MQPSAARGCCLWNGWSLDPFALYQGFPDALSGRHSTDSYGSAAPAEALATCPPTHCWEPERVPALLAEQLLRQRSVPFC